MTVNTISITSGPYIGNDIATSFSYGFRVQNKNQLRVFETTDTGVETELTVDTDYTVNNIGEDNGGTITRLAGALPTGYRWYIRSNYQETQDTAFNSQGAFFPEIHENAFDKLTFLIQQLVDKSKRALRFSDSSDIDDGMGLLPSPESEKLLRWKLDESGLENVDVSSIDPDAVVITDYIKKINTIATLRDVAAVDGQSFLIQDGDDAGVYTYDASATGAETFYRIIPTSGIGRYLKQSSNEAKVTFNAVETPLDTALENVRSTGASNTSNIFTLTTTVTNNYAKVLPTRFLPPAGFNYNPPFAIFSDVYGRINTSLDVAAYKYKGNGAYCWIDPTKSDDSGDGLTPATAKKNLQNVLASSTTYETIYLVPGALIDRTPTVGWGGALTVSKNIICPGGRAKITRRFMPISWTNEGGGVFSCARTGTRFVWDATRNDEFGDYILLPKVASIGALAGVSEGWWSDDVDLYVKRLDLAEPNINSTAIFLAEGSANGSAIINGNAHVYFENIDFEGGYAPLYARPSAAGQNLKVFAKSCTFKYSYLQDGVTIIDAKMQIMQSCSAARNVKDGFNYHADLYGEPGVAIEVDCAGWRNGITQEAEPYSNNRNGTTSHDGITTVRVNGNFYDCHGPVVVDVVGTKTWCVGVAAHHSQGTATDQSCAFFVGEGGAEMWLDRCVGFGSDESYVVGAGCTLYTRDCYFEGTANVIGTLTPY